MSPWAGKSMDRKTMRRRIQRVNEVEMARLAYLCSDHANHARLVDYLARCLLAEWHASPTTTAKPAFSPGEIKAWERQGFVEWRDGWRCTEAGRAELAIAGINTVAP